MFKKVEMCRVFPITTKVSRGSFFLLQLVVLWTFYNKFRPIISVKRGFLEIHSNGFSATSPTIFNTFTFYFIISLLQLSYAILLYEVENFIRQSKSHYLTIILVICFVVSLVAYIGWIFPRNLQGLVSNIIIWTMIPFALIIFYLGVFYLVLAKRSVGAVRHKALLVAFGIGFIFASIIFDLLYRQYCLSANIQIWWVLPVIFRAVGIIGVPMLIYGFRRESTLT